MDKEEMQGQGDEQGKETPLKDSPKVVIKKDGEKILEHEIDKDAINIGRHQSNDIVLDDRKVSRKHAQIKREDDVFTIEDMKSSGGTEVNGKKITSKQIFTGDVIKIADYELHFSSGLRGEERTVFDDEKTAFDDDRTKFYEEPVAKLVVIRAKNLEGDISVEGEVVLGRGDEADIQLEDERASRKNCKIAMVNNNFVITDLESANGTFVNGEKITEKELQNGDKIQIGNSVFEFKMEKGAMVASKFGKKEIFTGVGILAGVAVVLGIIILLMNTMKKAHPVLLSKVWTKTVKGPIHVCPAVGDLNSDGFNDVLVADAKGFIYALDGRTGGSIWNRPYRTGTPIFSSPCLGDVNQKDGRLDLIVGSDRGKVYTIDGDKGNLIWQSSVIKGAILSSPALADLNSDGVLDVVIGSKDKNVYALDGKQGGEIWYFNAKEEVETSPALTDVNGDGVPDVIIGAANNMYALSGKNGKRLWVHQSVGIPSSPAVGKFNDDDIEDVAVTFTKEVVVLDGKTGAMLWKWDMPFALLSDLSIPISPVLGDCNRDGVLDIVCVSRRGHVYAVDGASQGKKYLWDYRIEGDMPSSCSLFDFNGDRTPDVAVTSQRGSIYVISGKDGHLLAQFDTHEKIGTPVAIADVNSNKLADLVIGTVSGKVIVIESNARCRKNEILWGALRKDRLHTARVE